jgi:hypothetical protein
MLAQQFSLLAHWHCPEERNPSSTKSGNWNVWPLVQVKVVVGFIKNDYLFQLKRWQPLACRTWAEVFYVYNTGRQLDANFAKIRS